MVSAVSYGIDEDLFNYFSNVQAFMIILGSDLFDWPIYWRIFSSRFCIVLFDSDGALARMIFFFSASVTLLFVTTHNAFYLMIFLTILVLVIRVHLFIFLLTFAYQDKLSYKSIHL